MTVSVDTLQRIIDMPNKPLGSLAQHIAFQLDLIERTKTDIDRLQALKQQEISKHDDAMRRLYESIRQAQANCPHVDVTVVWNSRVGHHLYNCNICGAKL